MVFHARGDWPGILNVDALFLRLDDGDPRGFTLMAWVWLGLVYTWFAPCGGTIMEDPIVRFESWFSEAVEAEHPMPEAMTLATVDAAGRPNARMVLLKAVDNDGFVFFTNYQSQKAKDLSLGTAALVFWWENTRRQVRVRGTVEKTSAEESDAYFASRSRQSQLGAWASPQSQPIPARADLEARFEAAKAKYADQPVPRPVHWGGYRLTPTTIEFWTEGSHRLHDREVFRRDNSSSAWTITRLAP